MTIPLNIILLILLTHFIADFFLQSSWMAMNKSKDNVALTVHVCVYAVCFLPFFGVAYALINFLLHFATDYVSSKVLTKLWNKAQLEMDYDRPGAIKTYHWFFTIIGLDQMLHFMALFITYYLMFV